MADDLTLAQAWLGRTLARTHGADAAATRAKVRERGVQLVQQLGTLLRLVQHPTNDARKLDLTVTELHRTLELLRAQLGVVHLVTVDERAYVNDLSLELPAGLPGQASLGAELLRHNVGGLSFTGDLSAGDVHALALLLGGPAAASQPRAALGQALGARAITGVALYGVFHFAALTDAPAQVEPIARRLGRAVEASWEDVATGRPLDLLALRRLVTELQRSDPASEANWLQSPEGFSDHGWHAWKMTQLTLVVSSALGLPRGVQQDYALAALLHDIGYAVPLPQAQGLHAHGTAGVVALIRQQGFHEAKTRRLNATWQHHGELTVQGQRAPLVTRVMRVLEDYEALQRSRPTPCAPPDALGHLAGGAGPHYDPVVVQTLINCLGAYPPGTFLELEDGRVVRSASGVRSAQTFSQPRALVVGLPGRRTAPPNTFIDLATEGKVKRVLRPRGA